MPAATGVFQKNKVSSRSVKSSGSGVSVVAIARMYGGSPPFQVITVVSHSMEMEGVFIVNSCACAGKTN